MNYNSINMNKRKKSAVMTTPMSAFAHFIISNEISLTLTSDLYKLQCV